MIYTIYLLGLTSGMRWRIRNIMAGAGSVLDIWPAEESDDLHRRFIAWLRVHNDRPPDYYAVLADMREAMLQVADTLPAHERARLSNTIERLKRRERPADADAGRNGANGQFELFGSTN